MTWLAWRQYRLEIYLAVAFLAVMTAFLLPTGISNLALFRDSGLEGCLSSGVADCSEFQNGFFESYSSVNSIINWFTYVPVVVGLLLAAPVVMEIERRSYRLAWTQSFTRWQWLAAMVGMAIISAAVFSALFTALMTWWYGPVERAIFGLGHGVGPGFSFAGLMPFSFILWTMSLALAAGVLSRRVIVAAVAALVGLVAARIPIEVALLPSYETTPDGVVLNTGQGVADVFWRYQAIEAAIFISASAVLLGVMVWVVNRRMR